MKRPQIEDFYDESDPRGPSSSELLKFDSAMSAWNRQINTLALGKAENKATTISYTLTPIQQDIFNDWCIRMVSKYKHMPNIQWVFTPGKSGITVRIPSLGEELDL